MIGADDPLTDLGDVGLGAPSDQPAQERRYPLEPLESGLAPLEVTMLDVVYRID